MAFILLIIFFISLSDLRRESLWNDEAWTAWAVRSPYVRDTLERVQADVHPPLYFMLIDGWTQVMGESVFALRVPSALLGLLGLAATYAVGAALFDRPTGLIAVVLMGTAGLYVYYTREARMYTVLLSLSALSMLCYLRWRRRFTLWRGLAYALSMAALLYTHYAGALLIGTHLLHGVIVGLADLRRGKSLHGFRQYILMLLPYALALVLFAPWLPTFLSQMRANPNGPLAIPVPTDWATVAGLVLILVGGNWWVYLAPFVLGSGIVVLWKKWRAALLLILWLLITPVALLALNAWFAPVYQVRYAIGMLPAGALLIAVGLRWLGRWERTPSTPSTPRNTLLNNRVLQSAAVLVVLGYLAIGQLNIISELWPEKPPWEPTIRGMIDARTSLQPTITDFAPYSPAAYYDRQLHIRQGVSLDLSWRLHSPQEVSQRTAVFANEPSVWVALPVNTVKTWEILANLDATRHIGYRASLVNMIFYRFDEGDSDDLQFRFGDVVRFEDGPGAEQLFALQAGDSLDVNFGLKTLQALDGTFSAGLHLVDITGTQTVAQWDGGIGSAVANSDLNFAETLAIPTGTPPGHYHLELVVYNWGTLERLPVFEDSGETGLRWGDVLMLAAVDITE